MIFIKPKRKKTKEFKSNFTYIAEIQICNSVNEEILTETSTEPRTFSHLG
jgi:hypothetical protein